MIASVLIIPDWSTSFHAISSLTETTKNPYDLRRDPCSGTAAAIAADLGIIGLDSDTDGNASLSASFCALVGFRPRPGMISRYGMSPLVLQQDTPAIITRRIRDTTLLYKEVTGFDPKDKLTSIEAALPPESVPSNEESHSRTSSRSPSRGRDGADASSLRIGVVEGLFGVEAECQEVNDLVRDIIRKLDQHGATILPVVVPKLQQWINTTQLYYHQSRGNLDLFFDTFLPHLGLSVKKIQEEGAFHPAHDFFNLLMNKTDSNLHAFQLNKHDDFRPHVMTEMMKDDVDFLAFPTCRILAPLTEDILNKKWTCDEDNFPTNTYLAAQTALPAISIPVGTTPEGLPVGMQLVSRPNHEQQLFKAAEVVQNLVDRRFEPRLDVPPYIPPRREDVRPHSPVPDEEEVRGSRVDSLEENEYFRDQERGRDYDRYKDEDDGIRRIASPEVLDGDAPRSRREDFDYPEEEESLRTGQSSPRPGGSRTRHARTDSYFFSEDLNQAARGDMVDLTEETDALALTSREEQDEDQHPRGRRESLN
jgi:amidase